MKSVSQNSSGVALRMTVLNHEKDAFDKHFIQ